MIALRIIGVAVNIVCPGIGTMIVGKIPQGITQFFLFVISLFCMFSVVFSLIGFPIFVVAWVWGIVSAANPKVSRR